MTRRRRGLLLVALALVLGGLAASDVARREAALERRLAPLVDVVVARSDLVPDRPIRLRDLAVRRMPARWAPPAAASAPAEVAGGVPAVELPRGSYVSLTDLAAAGPGSGGVAVRRGERAVEVVAAGSPELVVAGARVDVLVTREGAGTELALQDVEVLAAGAAAAEPEAAAGARVAATLRVTLRQAVYLTAAQSFARELRLLPRAAGDDRRAGAVAVGEGLR
ncbi:MAG TPA: Flp pilus assembly protein CpaB [Solirubrobacteraceae bacterium]|nr:Flp pilus assembly protein CpaB [Solirubrobacteraceae bacterium]